jgi:acid phosphatase
MIRVLAIGDAGEDTILRRQNIDVMRELAPRLDAVLVLGDNVYERGVVSDTDPRWEIDVERVYPHGLPCLALLGNHDYLGDPEAQVRKTFLSTGTSVQWVMPKRYYMCTLDHEGVTVDVWMLDTFSLSPTESWENSFSMDMSPSQWDHLDRIGRHDKTRQLEWLRSSLAESTARWKIVCGHYPVLSDGGHGDNPELQQCLLPLFQQYGVNAYLCGHDHNLQHISFQGTQFLVSGTGSRHHAFRPRRSPVPSSATGVALLEFTATHMTMSFLHHAMNTFYTKTVPFSDNTARPSLPPASGR